jgi:inhibitor of KinA
MQDNRLPSLKPLGDIAWQLRWPDDSLQTTAQITALTREALQAFAADKIEVVPGLATLTFIPTALVDEEQLRTGIEQLINAVDLETSHSPRVVELPLCYDGDCGPDLDEIARHANLSREDVIERHLDGEYLVAMLGFSPGFPYLRGLPPELATPRRATPRLQIPAGSVGIAGTQTGIYPQATPGGWQLLGRTPTRLFSLDESPPTLLQPGDLVRFRRIDAADFARLQAAREHGADP